MFIWGYLKLFYMTNTLITLLLHMTWIFIKQDKEKKLLQVFDIYF